jgi:hypothetical protein
MDVIVLFVIYFKRAYTSHVSYRIVSYRIVSYRIVSFRIESVTNTVLHRYARGAKDPEGTRSTNIGIADTCSEASKTRVVGGQQGPTIHASA